jgi:hypothetical protein
LYGNKAEAQRLIGEALAASHARDVQVGAAFTSAMIGDTSQAQKIADQLDIDSPRDTMVQDYWLPSIRAMINLQRGDSKQAITILEVTTPYELGSQNVGVMVPVYVRGLAYLKAGQAELAAAEFKKILSHRGLALNSAI